ncbi:hypothetical protein NDU88_004238 [Pleurodeles waltl]|uniref:Uncharacterized protein n=1 Tax=Pleurodeles waltl TaxID=8319 RepID=A0AAV7V310_PLEWA|nr:hypothetical protein NDU88_004238 [Pleurodeles waltl]
MEAGVPNSQGRAGGTDASPGRGHPEHAAGHGGLSGERRAAPGPPCKGFKNEDTGAGRWHRSVLRRARPGPGAWAGGCSPGSCVQPSTRPSLRCQPGYPPPGPGGGEREAFHRPRPEEPLWQRAKRSKTRGASGFIPQLRVTPPPPREGMKRAPGAAVVDTGLPGIDEEGTGAGCGGHRRQGNR